MGVKWVGLVVAFSLCALLLVACARAPSERALRDAIERLQLAVDERDAGALNATLAEDFVGPDGLDRDGARRLAMVQFMRHDQVGIRTGPLAIRILDDHATVTFEVVVTGGSTALLPDSAQSYGIESGWRFEDGAWKLTSLQWTPRF